MKKNIFYFTPAMPPENSAAAVRNFWFVKVLKDDGHELSLVTGENLFFKLPTNKDSSSKRLIKEVLSGFSLFLKVLFSNNEIYIFSSPPFITIMFATIACWIRGAKYILDIRDIYPQVFFQLGLISEKSFAGKMALCFTTYAYKKAFSVITVTEGLVKIIKSMVSEKEVELIFNGYDPELFVPSADKFKNFTIVFHGNLAKFQRVDLIKDVATKMQSSHPDIHFKIIGQGPGERHLKSIPENLDYLGSMPYEDIGKYIAKCHVGISLRTDDQISRDAFPVKVFEYLGVGIPIIISPNGEAASFITKNRLGLQVDNNVDEIIDAILRCKKETFNVKSTQFSRSEQAKKIIHIIE